MERYSGTIVLALFVLLVGVAIFQTLPDKTLVGQDGFPVVRNTSYPLASVADSKCKDNNPDLYVIEPKIYERVGGSVKILGQATGAVEASVALTIVDDATKKIMLQDKAFVDQNYPCSFSKELQVGNFAAGGYTVQAYFTSPKDGSVVKQVEVPIQIQ